MVLSRSVFWRCYLQELSLAKVYAKIGGVNPVSSEKLHDFFFFYLGFTACQDYFTHFEPSQSLGGSKTGDPQERTPHHPQAELGLSHM